MVVKILTPNGWTEAEQLELFSSEEEFKVREYREVIPKQCGTCRYWIQSEKYFWKGKCRLADRERRSDEIKKLSRLEASRGMGVREKRILGILGQEGEQEDAS